MAGKVWAYIRLDLSEGEYQCSGCRAECSLGWGDFQAGQSACGKCAAVVDLSEHRAARFRRGVWEYAVARMPPGTTMYLRRDVGHALEPFACREQASGILKDLAGGDHLIVSGLSDFASTDDFAITTNRILRHGARLHVLEPRLVIPPANLDRADARAIEQTFAELATKSETDLRRREREKRHAHRVNQHPPRGYAYAKTGDGKVFTVPDPEKQRLMADLCRWRERGVPWTRIGSMLQEQGLTGPNGRPLCVRTLQRWHRDACRGLAD